MVLIGWEDAGHIKNYKYYLNRLEKQDYVNFVLRNKGDEDYNTVNDKNKKGNNKENNKDNQSSNTQTNMVNNSQINNNERLG